MRCVWIRRHIGSCCLLCVHICGIGHNPIDIDEFIMEQGGNDVAVEYNNTNRILTAQIREASLGRSTALFLLATEKISL